MGVGSIVLLSYSRRVVALGAGGTTTEWIPSLNRYRILICGSIVICLIGTFCSGRVGRFFLFL